AERVDPAVWPVLAEAGAIVSVNATPKALGEASALLTAFVGARILVSHLGLPSAGAASSDELTSRLGPLLQLAHHDLVSVKVSGLYAVDPVFPHTAAIPVFNALLSAFGAGRLLWGSDFTPGLDAVSVDELFAIPEWMQACLSEAELRQVMSENLLTMLRED
ncbi:MAG TPA: amidohydrolase family protein, partial [Gemmatimonadaceae bacterium]|nr:amidohydrolase family protein [Gemmatimonadaceae bacterium]